MKFSTSRTVCPLLVASATMLAGCGTEGFPVDGMSQELTAEEASLDDGNMSIDEQTEYGQAEEALASFCGGQDTNMLAAGLAVAIGKELQRWDRWVIVDSASTGVNGWDRNI